MLARFVNLQRRGLVVSGQRFLATNPEPIDELKVELPYGTIAGKSQNK